MYIGGGQVQNAVPVEIRQDHIHGLCLQSGDHLAAEGSVPIAQKDRDRGRIEVGYYQVVLAVAIEVTGRHGNRVHAHHIVGPIKPAGGPAQKHRD